MKLRFVNRLVGGALFILLAGFGLYMIAFANDNSQTQLKSPPKILSEASTATPPQTPQWVDRAIDFALAAQRFMDEKQMLLAPSDSAADPMISVGEEYVAAHRAVGFLVSMNHEAYDELKSETLNDLYGQAEFMPLLELLDAFDIISDNQDFDMALMALDAVQNKYDLSPDEQVIHDIFVAYTLSDRRDYAAALRHLSNAIRFKDKLSPLIAYQLLHAEIFMFERVDDFDRSIDRAFEILEFAKRNNINLNPQTLVNKYANSLRRGNFLQPAARVNEIAREISLETHNDLYIFLSHYVCGMIASDMGQNDKAISCFETAYPLRHMLKSRNLDFLVHYGKAEARAGDLEKARYLLGAAKSDPRFDGYVKIHMDVNRLEADLLFREGQPKSAYEALNSHFDTYLETEAVARRKASEELKKFTDKEAAWLNEKANTYAAKEALQRRVISRQRTLIFLTALLVLGLFGFAYLQRLNARKLREARQKTIAANHAIRAESRTDQLTRIGNRRAFYAYCEALTSEPADEQVTLAILDLDGFKQVNDNYGHDAGDILIQATGQRLDKALDGKGRIFRLGGDEFAIVFLAPDDTELTAFQTCVLSALSDPVSTEKRNFDIICSVGAVRVPMANLSPNDSLKRADYALYQAKKQAGFSFHQFSISDRERISRENQLGEEVLWNLENESFYMFGQGIIRHIHGQYRPFGVEALLRAQTRAGDVIKPEDFVHYAVSNGQADLLTKLTLQKSIEMLRGADLDCRLLFNLSREQMRGEDVFNVIMSTLDEMKFPPDQLIVELSEFTQNHDLYRASELLKQLKKIGVRIAIDDFGSGNTGLATLLEFDFDLIKTDIRMLGAAMKNVRTKLLMSKLIELTGELGVPCIVEGLETPTEVSFVTGLGGQYLQGYIFGRPEEKPKFRPFTASTENTGAAEQNHNPISKKLSA